MLPGRRHHRHQFLEHGLVEGARFLQHAGGRVQQPQFFDALAEIVHQMFALELGALAHADLGLRAAERLGHRVRRKPQQNQHHAHVERVQQPERDRTDTAQPDARRVAEELKSASANPIAAQTAAATMPARWPSSRPAISTKMKNIVTPGLRIPPAENDMTVTSATSPATSAMLAARV